MALYKIRPNFTIIISDLVYVGGQQVDLNEEEFELYKHRLEGTVSNLSLPSSSEENNFSRPQLKRINREILTVNKVLSESDLEIQHFIVETQNLSLSLPTTSTIGLNFLIKNSASSTQNLMLNDLAIEPGDIMDAVFDGIEWVVF